LLFIIPIYTIGTREGLSIFNVSPSPRRCRYKFAQTIICIIIYYALSILLYHILYCFVEIFFFFILNWLHPRNKTPCARYVHLLYTRVYLYTHNNYNNIIYPSHMSRGHHSTGPARWQWRARARCHCFRGFLISVNGRDECASIITDIETQLVVVFRPNMSSLHP